MLFTFPRDAFRFAIPKFLNSSTSLKLGTRRTATPGLPLLERGDELLSQNKKWNSRRTGVRKDTDTHGTQSKEIKGVLVPDTAYLLPRAFGVNSEWDRS